MNDKSAKLIKEEEIYTDGANVPTTVQTYECPCGKGIVEYGIVAGFNDRYARLKCETCEKDYIAVTGCGYRWTLRSIKKR